MSSKNIHTQLKFEFKNGLGDTRLRGVQGLGGLGQVQTSFGRFMDEFELMQVHNF